MSWSSKMENSPQSPLPQTCNQDFVKNIEGPTGERNLRPYQLAPNYPLKWLRKESGPTDKGLETLEGCIQEQAQWSFAGPKVLRHYQGLKNETVSIPRILQKWVWGLCPVKVKSALRSSFVIIALWAISTTCKASTHYNSLPNAYMQTGGWVGLIPSSEFQITPIPLSRNM